MADLNFSQTNDVMKKKYIVIGIVAICVLAVAGYAAWYSFERHEKIAHNAAAIVTCYHQDPGGDTNRPIPNNSVQYVKETSRMFINMPKDLYPKDIFHSWTTVSGNATAGYISNGGLPGEAEGAIPGCWSTYMDFEGSGEVDLRVKSVANDVPDYFVRFIVSSV